MKLTKAKLYASLLLASFSIFSEASTIERAYEISVKSVMSAENNTLEFVEVEGDFSALTCVAGASIVPNSPHKVFTIFYTPTDDASTFGIGIKDKYKQMMAQLNTAVVTGKKVHLVVEPGYYSLCNIISVTLTSIDS